MITNHTIYVDLASLICQYIWTFINYKYREMEQWEFSNSYSINCKNKEEDEEKEERKQRLRTYSKPQEKT